VRAEKYGTVSTAALTALDHCRHRVALRDFKLERHATFGVEMFVDDVFVRSAPPKACCVEEWIEQSQRGGGRSEFRWPHSSDSDPCHWLE
jgi:hypothetical protein